MLQFTAGIAICAFPLFLFAQNCPPPATLDDGQKIVVKQNNTVLASAGVLGNSTPLASASRSFTFELSDPKVTVPNNNCKDRNCSECGWYKAFWIFGDGNYKKFADDVAHMDAGSHQTAYTYAGKSTYQPAMYLTERYHNDKKPDAARVVIDLSGSTNPATPATDSPVLINAVNKRAAIDYNHDMRTEYPTVFVLSHLKDVNTSRVLFFYNALEENGLINPSDVMSYERTEVPSYFDRGVDAGPVYGGLNAAGAFQTKFPSHVFSLIGQQFGNCKEYSFDNIAINPALTNGLKEIRLFPVMNTASFQAGRIPTVPTVLLSVVLSKKPLGGDTLNTLRSQLQALFGEGQQQPDIGDNLQVSVESNQNGSSEYIVGIAEQRLAVLASHDPNNLFVTKIDTLPNGKYKVYFSLRICNQGEIPETKPTIVFEDLTGGHYKDQPVLTDPMTNVTVTWRADVDKYLVTLDGFNIGGIPANYEPRCEFVHFTLETDQTGVNRLYQDSPRAYKACVAFSGATSSTALECSENDLLTSSETIPPISDTPPVAGNDWWILLFLALLVLILIIYAWRNNNQPS